jgi:hypothetical protein
MDNTLSTFVTTEPNFQTKTLAIDFFRSITNSMRELVDASAGNDRKAETRYLNNSWCLLKCFWLSFKYNRRIKAEERSEVDSALNVPFRNSEEAFQAMDLVFRMSYKVGIFVDYSMAISNYDPEVKV